MIRLAGTRRLKTGSRVEESWWTSLLVGTPRSKTPGSVSSRITMQLPLIRGSSESTAAVTKLAKPMLVMNRPRLSTCRIGSLPSFHSATRTLPPSRPGLDADVRQRLGQANAPRQMAAVLARLGGTARRM